MHATLQPRENRKILLVWIVGSIALLVLAPTRLWLVVLAVGLSLGFIAGILQRITLTKEQPAFLAAESALDVRRAMRSRREGRASVALQWLAFLVLAIVCLRDVATAPSFMLGFLAFNFARDMTTYPAVVAMSRVSPVAPN